MPKKLPLPKSPAKPAAERYGVEGTNKTLPVPSLAEPPSGQLLNVKTKFVEKSPYTRR